MKKFVRVGILIFFLFSWASVLAQDRGQVWSDPKDVLNYIIPNDTTSDIIETELDKVDRVQWSFQERYRLANTLDSIRINIAIYLQWLAFALLVIWTSLIIYNWLRLVLAPLDPEEAWKIRQRLIYIIAWLLVGTGFYYLINIVLSVAIQISD